jgi:hypothetical protein
MLNSTINLRWIAKKAARTGVAVGSWSSGVLAGPGASEPRVLTYHRFGENPHDPFCVDTDTFTRQMEVLAESGRAVSLADIEGFLFHREALPHGAVLVTIDDGYRSTYSEALPVLRDLGVPAVAYIPAGCMDGTDDDLEPRMTWDQVAALADGGIAVGSHAWSHQSLGSMPSATMRHEVERSRELLEERTGIRVTSFAYPFGTRADYSAMSREALAVSGYRTAFTSQHGALDSGADPLELPRVKVEGGEPLWLFRLLIRGGLDAWSLVDRTLWRIQANRNAEIGSAAEAS